MINTNAYISLISLAEEYDKAGETSNGLYSKLKCEFDAKAYAKEAVSGYFDMIEEHLANTDEK